MAAARDAITAHVAPICRAAGADGFALIRAGFNAGDLLIWGRVADVRRTCAALGLSFAERTGVRQELRDVDGVWCGDVVASEGRASATIYCKAGAPKCMGLDS